MFLRLSFVTLKTLSVTLTLQAAPPLIIDLTKMPRSAWFSLERLPLTLTPKPADPESLRGISNVRNSRVPSGVNTRSSSAGVCSRGNEMVTVRKRRVKPKASHSQASFFFG